MTDRIASRRRWLLFPKRFALLFVFWLALTSNDPSAWFAGALSAAAAALISLRLLPPSEREVRPGAVLMQAPGLLWRFLLGGIDVAWRVFHFRVPLKPAWFVYPARLPRGGPRVWLGNVLSLVPGTLSAGGSGDALYVHCLDSEGPVEAHAAAEEKLVASAIGLTLENRHG